MKQVKVVYEASGSLTHGVPLKLEDKLRPYVEKEGYSVKAAYYADGVHVAILEKED